jgi:uncharacterized protein (DUF302 family)
MGGYTIAATIDRPYEETVEAVRSALADQGFGLLTEIDLRAILRKKLDLEVAPQVILGACMPRLAYEALQLDPSMATMLPCNVVVRTLDAQTTMLEAFDPDAMMSLSGNAGLNDVATDARQRLSAMLATLTEEN